MQFLAQNTKTIDLLDEQGNTILHIFTREGNYETVKVLVNNTASIIMEDSEGLNALHIACESGNKNITEFLLDTAKNNTDIDYKKYINSKTILGASALHYATQGNYENIINLLLAEGVTVNTISFGGITPLHHSSFHCNQFPLVKQIINKGAVIDSQKMVDSTPLLNSAANNCTKSVEFLLNNGANVNHQDKFGATALYIATDKGHNAVVKLLLQFGANPNITDNIGVYPIQLAVKRGDTLSVKYLLMHKTKIDDKNNENFIIPSIIAARYGQYKVLQQLNEKLSNIGIMDADGMNVIHAAATGGHIDIINDTEIKQLLFSYNKKFATAIHYAAAYNQVKAIRQFKIMGLDIDLRDELGLTPLHVAALSNNVEALEELIKEGANYYTVNFLGLNVFDIANMLSFSETKVTLKNCTKREGISLTEKLKSWLWHSYSYLKHYLYGFICKSGESATSPTLDLLSSEIIPNILTEAIKFEKSGSWYSSISYCTMYSKKSAQIHNTILQKKPCNSTGLKSVLQVHSYETEDVYLCEPGSYIQFSPPVNTIIGVVTLFSFKKMYDEYSKYSFSTTARSKAFWDTVKSNFNVIEELNIHQLFFIKLFLDITILSKPVFYKDNSNKAQTVVSEISIIQNSNKYFYSTQNPSKCAKHDVLSYNLTIDNKTFYICESDSYYSIIDYTYYLVSSSFWLVPTGSSLYECYAAFTQGGVIDKAACMGSLTVVVTTAIFDLTAEITTPEFSLSQYYANKYIKNNLENENLYLAQQPATCTEGDQSISIGYIHSILSYLWGDWQVCEISNSRDHQTLSHDEL